MRLLDNNGQPIAFWVVPLAAIVGFGNGYLNKFYIGSLAIDCPGWWFVYHEN